MEDFGVKVPDNAFRDQNEEMEKDNNDEVELPPGTEQLFSLEKKVKLFPVEVTRVLLPNSFIIRWLTSNDGAVEESLQEFELAENYQRHHPDFGNEGFEVTENVVVKLDNVTTDDGEDHEYFRGTITSKLSSSLYSVFLFDLGTIRNASCFEMTKLDDDLLPTHRRPVYILVTIPGIVPRKRLDLIPGLGDTNITDIRWNSQALNEVRTWLSMHKGQIMLHEIQPKSMGFSSILYGDLYHTKEDESDVGGHLSSYLIKSRNVFMDYKLLRQVFQVQRV